MTIDVICSCGRVLQASGNAVGKKVRCSQCRAAVPVPKRTSRRFVPARPPEKRLVHLLSVKLLAFVGFSFFLPMLVVSCGPVEAQFSGRTLALGGAPTISGMPAEMKSEGAITKSEYKDGWFLLAPLVAFLGAGCALLAFLGVSRGITAKVVTGAAILVLALYGYGAAAGFKIEREIKKSLVQAKPAEGELMPDMKMAIAVKKTPWFYAALLSSAGAAGLSIAGLASSSAPASRRFRRST